MKMKRILSILLCAMFMLSSLGINVLAETEVVNVNVIKGSSYTLPAEIDWDVTDTTVDTSEVGYQLFTGTDADGAAVTYRINVGEYKVLMQDDFESYSVNTYGTAELTKSIEGGTFYKAAYSGNADDKSSQQLVNDNGNTVASFGKGLSNTTNFTWTPADVAAGEAFKVSYKVKVESFDITEATATNYFFTNSFFNTEGIHLRAKVSGGEITATELRCVGTTPENFDIGEYIDWKYTDETKTVAYMDEYITVELFGDESAYGVKINGDTIAENIQWTNNNIYKGEGIGNILWAKRNSSTAAITYADDMVYSKLVYPAGDVPEKLTDTVETGTTGTQTKNFNLEMSDGSTKIISATYELDTADTASEGTVTVYANAAGFNFDIPVEVTVEEAPVLIESISDLSKEAIIGEEFTLPGTVTANMSDGTSQEVAVTWNGTASTEVKGIYTFTGTVDGYNSPITYTLTVRAVTYASTIVGQGDEFTLPAARNGKTITWNDGASEVDTTYVGKQIFKGIDSDGSEVVFTVLVGEQNVLIADDMESYTVGGEKPDYEVAGGTGGLSLGDGNDIVYENGESGNQVAQIAGYTAWGSFKMISPELATKDYIISGRFRVVSDVPRSGALLIAYNGANQEVCGIRINIDSSNGKLNIRNGVAASTASGANADAATASGRAFEHSSDEWIDFSIVVDKAAKSYSVYAKGYDIRLDVPYNLNAVTDPSIKSISIAQRYEDIDSQVFFDDLKITEYQYVTGELPEKLTDSVVSGVSAHREQNISLKMNDGTMRQFTVKYEIDPALSGVQTVTGRVDGFSETIQVEVDVDARTIVSIKPESLTNTDKVYVGTDYTLPSSITAIMSDEDENGSNEKEMNVTWNFQADVSTAGTYTYTGTVSGYDGTVTYTLTVSIDKPVSAESIEETLTLNEVYSLPSEVPVTLESGNKRNMEVNWNGAIARTDAPGTTVYSGYIVGYPEIEGGDGVGVSLTLNVIASAIAAPDYSDTKTSFDIILKDIADLPKKVGCKYENGMRGFEEITWDTTGIGEGAGPFAITGTLTNTDLAGGFDGVVNANVSFFNVPEPALQDGLDTFTYPFGDAMFPVGITLAYQHFPSNNEASFVCVLDPDNPDNKIMKYENRPEFDRNSKFNYDALQMNAAKGGFLVAEADIKMPRGFTDTRFRLLTGASTEFIVIDFYGDKSMKVRNVDLIQNVIPIDEWFRLSIVVDTTAQTAEGRFYDIYINGVYICTAPWYQEPSDTNGVGKGVMRFDFRNDKDESFVMYLDNVNLYFLNDLMEDAYTQIESIPSTISANSISLPNTVGNTTITWASSDEDVISTSGVVTRPAYNQSNANVTLTATLSQQAGIFAANDTWKKTVRVAKVGATDADMLTEAVNGLTLPSETSSDLNLRSTYGSATIRWASSNASVIDEDGRVYPPEDDTEVTLTATITSGSETATKTFVVKVLHTETLTDLQKVRAAMNSVNLPQTTSQNVSLPGSINGVDIIWISNNLSVIASDGTLISTRPSSSKASLTATFILGDVYETKTYTLTVTKSTSGSSSGGGGGGGGGGSFSSSTNNDLKSDAAQPEPTITETPSAILEPFTDLADYEWAKESIYSLYEKGLVNGISETMYAPATNIKREEFAAMMVRLAELEGSGIENVFTDAQENDWFYNELLTAYEYGIVNGMGDGTFGAGLNITRQDIAVILCNLAKKYGVDTTSATVPSFSDYKNTAEYAKDSINFLCEKGIINGAEGKLMPEKFATRAEAAKMINEFITKLEIEDRILGESTAE